MAASVEFLEKMKELQDVNYESENKRLQLEQELNSYAKSDTRMARLKAVRLQNYWKKICEDEKRSQWRNEQLLQDFDRVEAHMDELSARTERLRVMKKQYEEYIERMYPQWKEKVIFMKQQRELAEKRAKENVMMGHVGVGGPAPGLVPPGAEVHMHRPPSSISTGLSPSQISSITAQSAAPTYTTPSALPQGQAAPQFPDAYSLQYAAEVARNAQLVSEGRLTQDRLQQQLQQAQTQVPAANVQQMGGYRHGYMSPGETALQPQPSAGGPEFRAPSAASTLQTISSLPTGTDLTSIQARALAAANQSTDFSGAQTWESSDLESATATGQGYYGNEESYLGYPEVQTSALQTIESQSAEESVESPKQATVRPMKSSPGRSQGSITIPDAKSIEPDTARTEPSSARSLSRDSVASGGKAKSKGEHSQPLSQRESARSGSQAVPTRAPSPGHRSRQNSQSSLLGDKSEERSIYPEADVTLEGLYNLLDAVQEVLTATRQTKEFYRTDPPPTSVRNDIIENCNKGQMLSHVDPTSISMVALEQLPLVVQNCMGGSLLPDSYLYTPYPDTDYDSIRSNIHPTSIRFWDRLCEHFVALVRFNIMNCHEVGDVFGPMLIGDDSPYEDKAKALLSGMLDGVEVVDPVSPGSTASLSSMLTPKITVPRPIPNEDVPPLDLPPSQSESDTFFSKPIAQSTTNPGASLTQTAAYRQLLGTGGSTQKSGDYEDSEDDEYDIEKQLTKSLTSPRPKPTVSKAAPATTATSPTPVAAKAAGGTKPSVGSDVSSPDLSPPLSPTSPPAYVPSALTSTGKSTLSMSSTGKAAKRPGFRFGDSDTDEEVDLEGTGPGTKSLPHGMEQDDFDFYD